MDGINNLITDNNTKVNILSLSNFSKVAPYIADGLTENMTLEILKNICFPLASSNIQQKNAA